MTVIQSKKTPLVIFGAGGHAKTVISVALDQKVWEIVGVVTDEHLSSDLKEVLGVPILGGRESLAMLKQNGVHFGFVAIGNDKARQVISQMLIDHDFELATIVHPTAVIMTNAVVAAGSLLHAYSLVGAETLIGQGCIIQPYVSVGHESRLGCYTQLCPGVRIGGQAVLGDYCFLGPNAVIYPKVSLGNYVSVGANSTVNKSVPNHHSVIEKSSRKLIRHDV